MNTKKKYTSLSHAIKELKKNGFSERFEINLEGTLETEEGELYLPSEVTVSAVYSFENKNNPNDLSSVYAIKTEGGEKGMLIEASGSRGRVQIADFLRRTEQQI